MRFTFLYMRSKLKCADTVKVLCNNNTTYYLVHKYFFLFTVPYCLNTKKFRRKIETEICSNQETNFVVWYFIRFK